MAVSAHSANGDGRTSSATRHRHGFRDDDGIARTHRHLRLCRQYRKQRALGAAIICLLEKYLQQDERWPNLALQLIRSTARAAEHNR